MLQQQRAQRGQRSDAHLHPAGAPARGVGREEKREGDDSIMVFLQPGVLA